MCVNVISIGVGPYLTGDKVLNPDGKFDTSVMFYIFGLIIL